MKTYREMMKIPDYNGRLEYLKLHGKGFEINENVNRYLHQYLYHTAEWRKVRREVLIRDGGFDLGVRGIPIEGRHLVHHIEPLTVDDVISRSPKVFDLDNLILVSHETHNAIHYGTNPKNPILTDYVERKPGDTKLW